LLPVGFAVPALLPGPRCALTAPFHPCLGKRGGLLSAALSLGSPPPEVIRHRASKEPGLSSLSADTLAADRAAVRPADTGNKGLMRSTVKSEAALHLRLLCLSRISRRRPDHLDRVGGGRSDPRPRRRRTKSALLGYSRGWARDLGIAATVAFLASPAAGYITEPRSRWMAASTLNRRCRRRSRGAPHRLPLHFFVNW